MDTMDFSAPDAAARDHYRVKFHADGGKLFGIIIVNMLLTFVTLGIYYPWARAKLLRYFYGETEFHGNRFEFHGTGKEMFFGFIKAIAIIVVIYAFLMYGIIGKHFLILFIGYILAVAIIPFAIHGALRYRMSRTSWRGIRFGYHGDLKELGTLFFKNIVYTIFTLGIYGSWMQVNLHRYTQGNIRMGNAQLKFNGDGGDFFWLNFKGFLLTIVTLYIYAFWWVTDIHKFYINNTTIIQDGQEHVLRTHITGWGFFKLVLVNILIVIFTLGIGIPWVRVRTMRFYIENMEIDGSFDAEALIQTEGDYSDATGDDMLSMMDLNLG
jgi:uncharacterized membrane protein YjgN (DUF898 family)